LSNSARHPALESLLAHLLDKGTWLASAVIGVGLLLTGVGRPGMSLVRVGVALFIALPIARVLVMMVVFWRERDYRFSMIALFVLLIIAIGVVCAVLLRVSVH
jgi:uncharacterized membrane protein